MLWAGGLAVWGPTPAVMDPPVGIAAPGPRIAFAEMEFDFGELKQGQVVKHDFVFTNTGTEKLEILDVRPSCGCTTAGTWDRVIEAGATGRIPVQFSSVGFSGAISKSVAVTSTDPARSTVSLKIKANIFIPIEVSPTMAYFQYDGGETNAETKTIRILSHLKEALTLLSFNNFLPSQTLLQLPLLSPLNSFGLKFILSSIFFDFLFQAVCQLGIFNLPVGLA